MPINKTIPVKIGRHSCGTTGYIQLSSPTDLDSGGIGDGYIVLSAVVQSNTGDSKRLRSRPREPLAVGKVLPVKAPSVLKRIPSARLHIEERRFIHAALQTCWLANDVRHAQSPAGDAD